METFPREKVTRKKSERIENNNLLMLEHTSDNMLNVKFVRNGSIKSV